MVVEDASYSLNEDEADRPVLFASGAVQSEGNTEYREVSPGGDRGWQGPGVTVRRARNMIPAE